MRIAIDALGIHYFGGGRTATLTLFNSLFAIDQQNQYCIYLCKEEPSLHTYKNNVQQIVVPIKNRILLRLWAQLALPIQERNYDLIHFSKNLGVFGLNIPSVVTIYDMTTLVHPELFPKLDVYYWKTLEKRTLQNVNRIIAISRETARDIQNYYGIPSNKIRIIYPSIDPRFRPASNQEVNHIQEKYRLPKRYILHVGRIDLKKKLTLLVEAYALAKKNSSDGFLEPLVMVGEIYSKSKDNALLPMVERLGLSKNVLFTGQVPDEDLPAIISGAKVTVSASIHEGFGLAAVESLACGTPLIAYRAGALEEVVGDAALLINSLDKESIAKAILEVINFPELHKQLSRRGIIRAQDYQGLSTAHQTIQIYEEIVKEKRNTHTSY
jgi:glycosyltransferase involved in cell wall biosynthesis